MNRKVFCVLCQRSEETEKTGNLMTEDEVTAHYKCMLYSADLVCQDSPQYGDMCGFRAEDVKLEVTRGRMLVCHRCKKRGATVGCEVVRCKKSYHYPCAVEDGAKPLDDDKEGKYVIYCLKHYPQANKGSMMTHDSNTSQTSGCSANGGRPAKRTLSQIDARLGGSSAKRSTEDPLPSLSEDFVDAEESNTDMDMYAPLESDIEDSENSEQKIRREAAEEPAASTSGETLLSFDFAVGRVATLQPPRLFPGGRREDDSPRENNGDDDTILYSPELGSRGRHLQSLLLPVELCVDSMSCHSEYSQRSPASSQPALLHSEHRPAGGATEDFSPVQSSGPGQGSMSPPTSSHEPAPPSSLPMCPPPTAPLRPPPPSAEPSSFWKSCNAAGCTEAIFLDFFSEMSDVAKRIRSDQASDEDCRLALSVMAASGKLAAYVAKQHEELKRKQQEVQKASAAMMEVVTALKNRPSAGATASL